MLRRIRKPNFHTTLLGEYLNLGVGGEVKEEANPFVFHLPRGLLSIRLTRHMQWIAPSEKDDITEVFGEKPQCATIAKNAAKILET